MIPRSTTLGPSAVLGEVARGMEIDDTLLRDYGISQEDVRAAIWYAALDRLQKKLFNPSKLMMVHVRAIHSKIKGEARDVCK